MMSQKNMADLVNPFLWETHSFCCVSEEAITPHKVPDFLLERGVRYYSDRVYRVIVDLTVVVENRCHQQVTFFRCLVGHRQSVYSHLIGMFCQTPSVVVMIC